jgi:hypothetical protein
VRELWLGQASCQRVRRLLRLSGARWEALSGYHVTNETLDYPRVIAAHAARCTARQGVGSTLAPPCRYFAFGPRGSMVSGRQIVWPPGIGSIVLVCGLYL